MVALGPKVYTAHKTAYDVRRQCAKNESKPLEAQSTVRRRNRYLPHRLAAALASGPCCLRADVLRQFFAARLLVSQECCTVKRLLLSSQDLPAGPGSRHTLTLPTVAHHLCHTKADCLCICICTCICICIIYTYTCTGTTRGTGICICIRVCMCMCLCVCVCMRMCMSMCMCVCAHVNARVCMYIYIYIYMFVCVSVCIHTYVYIYTFIHIYIYICVCVRIHVYIYIHI